MPDDRHAAASSSATSPGKLHVGFWASEPRVGAWAAKMIQAVHEAHHSTVALLAFAGREHPARAQDACGSLLYRAYRALDERAHTVPAAARAPVDVRTLLPSGSTKIAETGAEASPQTAERLDVLVTLGREAGAASHAWLADAWPAPRYGVWAHHFGQARWREDRAGFWEVFQDEPVTPVSLRLVVPGPAAKEEAGAVLYRSYSATDAFSVKRSGNALLWKAAALVPRALAALHRAGTPYAAQPRVERTRPDAEAPAVARAAPPCLTTRPFAPLLAKHFLAYARERIAKRRYRERWRLLYRFEDAPSLSFGRFKPLVAPPGSGGWGDPCVWNQDGGRYVFVEEIDGDTGKGHIAVFLFDKQGRPAPPQKIIEAPHHLSYPFLFEYEGTLYMMPEAMESGAIGVYECTNFPHEWVFRKNIMEEVLAVDPTLLYHDDRWWLFAGMKAHEHASANDELFLFHARDPLGTRWQPHPQNPIVSDARRARPAGHPFEHGGALYRPSQDCSRRYGYGLRLNRITALSPTEYAEEEVASATPTWNRRARGVHTFSHDDGLTFADARVQEPR